VTGSVMERTVEMPQGFVQAKKIQDGGVECDEVWVVLCERQGVRAFPYQVIEWVPVDRMMCDAHYFNSLEDAKADFDLRTI